MKILKRLAAALGLLLAFGLAHTAHSEPLSAQQVERFIASLPELNALGDKHDDGQRRKIDRARPLTSSLEHMDRDSPAYNELALLASRHGFSSAEQLADVGDRTLQAYSAAKIEQSVEELEANYQRGVSRVKNDPELNEDQKDRILKGMARTHQRGMEAHRAAAQDIPAVQAHLLALDQLLN